MINQHRFLILLAIIFAGEMIFSLAFHIPRFFRPTLLEVFQLTNTQLGDIFAIYGLIAALAYFPGGILADYFSTRQLMTSSLVITALGGFYLYQLPSITELYWLFAYWGLTTILMFWAAMIKATREWANTDNQGLAFGALDGGRGLVASLFASIAIIILSHQLAQTGESQQLRQQALQSIILFYSFVTLAAAVIVYLLIPNSSNKQTEQHKPAIITSNIRDIFRNRSVWLQAGIVVCAYCGYKALDNYGLFAVQVLKLNEIEAAQLVTFSSYSRPIAAIVAGLIVDRYSGTKVLFFLFGIASLCFLSINLLSPLSINNQTISYLLIANLLLTFIGVYALRGVYFTLLEESQTSNKLTGTAVGLISAIGFTPDIFFAPITGRILDANPGAAGFQDYFSLMALISATGVVMHLFIIKTALS